MMGLDDDLKELDEMAGLLMKKELEELRAKLVKAERDRDKLNNALNETVSQLDNATWRLEKAEKVIDAFHKGLTQVNRVPIEFADACAALREYLDMKYREVLRIDEVEETK